MNTEYLFGYVDRTGRFVIPPQYLTAETFENGLARVTYLGPGKNPFSDRIPVYTINTKGQTTYVGDSPAWSEDESHDYGGGPSGEFGGHADKDLWLCGYRTPGTYSEKELWVGYIHIEDKGKYKRNCPSNLWVIPPKFNNAQLFQDGVAWVMMIKGNEKYWGLINKKGDYLLPPICNGAGDFREGLAPCRVKVYFRTFYWTLW